MNNVRIASDVGEVLEEAQSRAAGLLLTTARAARKDFEALDDERVNLLAGMDWCKQHQQWEMVVNYARVLADFMDIRGYWYEARLRLKLAIEVCGVVRIPVKSSTESGPCRPVAERSDAG